jgi:threonine synthase
VYVTALVCTHCGAEHPLDARLSCDTCLGPLEPAYDYAALRTTLTRERIEAGPRTLWRYVDLLPVAAPAPGALPVGLSPLVNAPRLAEALGLRELHIKIEAANPTHSFKDRVVSVAVTAARELGFERIACASTGNLGNSVAAHAARIGMPSIVFVPSDLEAPKIVQSAIYGGTLVGIQGSYDDVNRLCSELSETDEFENTGFVNVNVRPYYAEGSKTLGYEVAEQLGWRLPGQYVAPMASGSMLTKIHKSFKELVAAGLVPSTPWAVFGAQSAGCAPIATAFSDGSDIVRPVKPTGIAKSLNIGNPADGPYALNAVHSTGGAMAAVGDDEIREGIRLLARTTGVFAETAGGVTVAVLRKLVASGAIDTSVETVVFNTGDGLKTIDAVSEGARPTAVIPPTLKGMREAGLL